MTGCVIGKYARIGFQNNSLTSKMNCVWESNFNFCFGIMKTPFPWNGSLQVMELIQSLRTINKARQHAVKHAFSPPSKKCKPVASVGKVLLTFFFDVQGPLLVEFLEHRRTITSDVHFDILQRLKRSINNKSQGLLTEGVVLLHDNARSNMFKVTQAGIGQVTLGAD